MENDSHLRRKMMKRILVVFLMLAIVLAGCSNKGEKYQKRY
ncbi:prokaryotic membrane lipolipid attachment site family protein [Staphylococcus aureus subsp. aureus CIG1176]|nr:Hypothetical protein SAZ172_0302 [Staphylococcus aureus subsp. aureus Z172]AID38727.1 hypothetical protein SAXN108_0286 [Staphylococcus aureus]EGS98850.1 conserved domain protein [Staphylococcus aureus subsp. aureus 21195]EHM64033.1 prokaryotic membrane lipoprotein lipid attachment site [Staphylococcus aureus subsp. aureus 21178]EHO88454.1 prokaryotic membrane lipoprotein lipid attachment site [Staphylococcus aureus subsp. aureus 21264]EHQ64537.1 prokaryotic membrane lipoprotein lipid attac